jgi:hypothetical protein
LWLIIHPEMKHIDMAPLHMRLPMVIAIIMVVLSWFLIQALVFMS